MQRERANRADEHVPAGLPAIYEDPWSAYYNIPDTNHPPSQAFDAFALGGRLSETHDNCDDLSLASTPIFIDSGSSFSVDGRTRLQACGGELVKRFAPHLPIF